MSKLRELTFYSDNYHRMASANKISLCKFILAMPFVPSSEYLDHIFNSEESLCRIYPLSIQQLDKIHWSPLLVIYKAIHFLGENKGAKILDIGSGSGKFCLSGCYYKPSAFLFGVEQRAFLVDHSLAAKEKLGRLRVSFFHKNFTQ